MSIAYESTTTGATDTWAPSAPPSPRALRLVLDALCDLRAADEEYGPGDSYFGQTLAEVRDRLTQLTTRDIDGAVESLVAAGLLRTYCADKDFVWVSNAGWRSWSRWDNRLAYLLAHEKPLPR
jgi:hypothetical protein